MSIAATGSSPASQEPQMESKDGNRVDHVLHHTRVIRSETGELIAELREAGEQLRQTLDLQGRMQRHPYATMAAALGVGYVLGGGLFSRLTGTAVRLGAKALLLPMLRSELASLGEAALAQADRGQSTAGSEDGEGGL